MHNRGMDVDSVVIARAPKKVSFRSADCESPNSSGTECGYFCRSPLVNDTPIDRSDADVSVAASHVVLKIARG